MVLCLIALPIFAILGIFSVKYRKLTLDALDCLFRTATLRKCRSGVDDKIRADVSGTILKYSPKVAKMFYRHYKIVTFIVLIIFLWSAYEGGIGTYNYIVYGNCNGPESAGFCVFDPTGGNSKITEVETVSLSKVVLPILEDDDPIIGPLDAEFTVIEFGCYVCPYTKKAEPIIQEVIDYYEGKVNFQFKNFYIPLHELSYESALATGCAQEQNKYFEYHDALFDSQEVLTIDSFGNIAEDLGLDVDQFNECFSTEKYKNEVDGDSLMAMHAGVPGTPTFFIGDQKIVGPKPFKTFKKVINKKWGLE